MVAPPFFFSGKMPQSGKAFLKSPPTRLMGIKKEKNLCGIFFNKKENCKGKNLPCWGQSHSTEGRVLVLHTAHPGLIPGITLGLPETATSNS